jgi:hypothetical protein
MITPDQYFGKPHSPAQATAAVDLLQRVNPLVDEAVAAGAFTRQTNPHTGCEINGSSGGDGDGGFRTPASTTGAPGSSHKEAKAVDVDDAGEALDTWLDQFEDGQGGNSKLEQYGLYREHPSATKGWCHLTTRAPASGHRTFMP